MQFVRFARKAVKNNQKISEGKKEEKPDDRTAPRKESRIKVQGTAKEKHDSNGKGCCVYQEKSPENS
jgi:hypothetical protein